MKQLEIAKRLSDLIMRLRRRSLYGIYLVNPDGPEAADEIECLRRHINVRYSWYSRADYPDFCGDIDEVLDHEDHGSVVQLETHYTSDRVWAVAAWSEEGEADHKEFATKHEAEEYAKSIRKKIETGDDNAPL